MQTDIIIYAADAVATGRLPLAHDRVSDLLADVAPVMLQRVTVRALDDGRRHAFDLLELGRTEILVAVPGEPRGNPSRRLGTVARPALARIGPYEIAGRLHGPPCTDPFVLSTRRDWVALTDATITYSHRGRLSCETYDTIVLNRRLTASLVPVEDDLLDARRPVAMAGMATGRAWFQPVAW